MIDERFFDEEFDEMVSKQDPSLYLMDDVEKFYEDEERMLKSIGLGDVL